MFLNDCCESWLPLTRSSAAYVSLDASFSTMHLYVPPCDRATLDTLSALVNSSFCRIIIGFSWPARPAAFLAVACPSDVEVPAFTSAVATIGTSSFSHVNVNGKSPVPTTHWTLTRSPTLTSRANSNGVIFGGTNSIIDYVFFFVRSFVRTFECMLIEMRWFAMVFFFIVASKNNESRINDMCDCNVCVRAVQDILVFLCNNSFICAMWIESGAFSIVCMVQRKIKKKKIERK